MHTEISRYLDSHRNEYLNYLKMLRRFFNDSRLPGIKTIYSRGAKQPSNDEFKETWKIAQRIEAEQSNNAKDFNVADVWDVVALTVVFNYEYECQTAENFAREKGATIFSVLNSPDESARSARGYYARHLITECKNAECFGTLCEIQLKTVLHDAWGNKTHDLSYKPIDQLDRRIQEQMELIGSMLQGVERQSEILRSLVEEQWTEDNERRAAARRALIFDIIRSRAEERKDVVWNVATALQNKENTLTDMPVDNQEIQGLIAQIDSLRSSSRYGDASVLATYLACIRRTPDLNKVAEYYIDKWREAGRTGEDGGGGDLTEAEVFHAYALYVLGDIRRAIDVTEMSLKKCPGARRRLQLEANLAYYLAESPTSSQEEWARNKKRAEALVAQVEAERRDDPTAALLNTKGFVKIAFGSTEEEIRSGINACRDAIASPGSDPAIAEHFFAFQERKAWRRLLKF